MTGDKSEAPDCLQAVGSGYPSQTRKLCWWSETGEILKKVGAGYTVASEKIKLLLNCISKLRVYCIGTQFKTFIHPDCFVTAGADFEEVQGRCFAKHSSP